MLTIGFGIHRSNFDICKCVCELLCPTDIFASVAQFHNVLNDPTASTLFGNVCRFVQCGLTPLAIQKFLSIRQPKKADILELVVIQPGGYVPLQSLELLWLLIGEEEGIPWRGLRAMAVSMRAAKEDKDKVKLQEAFARYKQSPARGILDTFHSCPEYSKYFLFEHFDGLPNEQTQADLQAIFEQLVDQPKDLAQKRKMTRPSGAELVSLYALDSPLS